MPICTCRLIHPIGCMFCLLSWLCKGTYLFITGGSSLLAQWMSHIPIHGRHFPCQASFCQVSHTLDIKSLSLHSEDRCQPCEVPPCYLSGDAPCRSHNWHGQGVLYPPPPPCQAGDDHACSPGIAPYHPGVSSMPLSGDRSVGVLAFLGSVVYASFLAPVDSPERPLWHAG